MSLLLRYICEGLLLHVLSCSSLMSSQSQSHTFHTGVQLPAHIKFNEWYAVGISPQHICLHSRLQIHDLIFSNQIPLQFDGLKMQ